MIACATALAACVDNTSATNLVDHGPPMVEQVRLIENFLDTSNTLETRTVFAFGNHPMATANDEHPVTSAQATNQKLRIIMSELLVGNYLTEISCRIPVGPDGAFDRVPVGSTPDDIAKCSVAKDVLPSTCPGNDPHSVCICQLAAGCGGTPLGQPVGVLDTNMDGAADSTRFINGAVGIRCGTTDVPIDLDMSYWNPSGDQQVPAMGGFDALGPAIVLVPNGALPTNETCGLTFSSDVIDKTNNDVCAPVGGRPVSCTGNLFDCPQTCTPGDVSAFSFQVQALSVTIQGLTDGDVGVDRTLDMIATSNAPLDPNSLGNIRILEAGLPFTGFTLTLPMPQTIRIHWTAGLAANTMYTITFPTTVTDTYGQGLVAPIVYHFTTGP